MFQRFKHAIIWASVLFVLVILLINVFFQTFTAQEVKAAPISNVWQPTSLQEQYWEDAGKNQVDILNITRFNPITQAINEYTANSNEFIQFSLKFNFGKLHTQYQDTYFISDLINGVLNAKLHGEQQVSLTQFVNQNTGSIHVTTEQTHTILNFEIHSQEFDTFIAYLFNALSASSFENINMDNTTLADLNIASNEDYINAITVFYQQYFHADNLQVVVSSPFEAQVVIDKIKSASTTLSKTFKTLPKLNEPGIFSKLPIVSQTRTKNNVQVLKVGFKINNDNSNMLAYLKIITTSLLADLPLSVKSKLNEKINIKNITSLIEPIDDTQLLFGLKLTLAESENIDTINILNIVMSYFNTLKINEFEIAYNQLKDHQAIVESTFKFKNSAQWTHYLNSQHIKSLHNLNLLLKNSILLNTFNNDDALSLLTQLNADNLYVSIESNQYEKNSTLRLSSRLLSQIRTIQDTTHHFSENAFNLTNNRSIQQADSLVTPTSILFAAKPKKVYEQSVTDTQIATELWISPSPTNDTAQFNLRLWANPSAFKNQQALSSLYAQYLNTQMKDLIWMAKQRDLSIKVNYLPNDHAFDITLIGPSEHSEKVWSVLLNQLFNLESTLAFLHESKVLAIKHINNHAPSKSIANQLLFNTLNSSTLTKQINLISINQLMEYENQLSFNDSIMFISNGSDESLNINILENTLNTLQSNNLIQPDKPAESVQADSSFFVSTKNKQPNHQLNNQHYIYKYQSPHDTASIYNRIQLSENSFRAQAFSLLFNQLISNQLSQLIQDKKLSDLNNSVSVNAFYKDNNIYIDFFLNSNKTDSALLHLHLKQLLSQPFETLIQLDSKTFEKNKLRIASQLKQRSKSSFAIHKSQWRHILLNHIHFNDHLRIANELENFQMDSFIRILKKQIFADNAKQLSIFDLGQNVELIKQYNTNKLYLEAITTIKSLDYFRKEQ